MSVSVYIHIYTTDCDGDLHRVCGKTCAYVLHYPILKVILHNNYIAELAQTWLGGNHRSLEPHYLVDSARNLIVTNLSLPLFSHTPVQQV